MGIMNTVKSGADLTHPKMTGGWFIGAAIAIVVLLAVIAVGTWIYKNSVAKIGNLKPAAASTGSMVTGLFGNGT